MKLAVKGYYKFMDDFLDSYLIFPE